MGGWIVDVGGRIGGIAVMTREVDDEVVWGSAASFHFTSDAWPTEAQIVVFGNNTGNQAPIIPRQRSAGAQLF